VGGISGEHDMLVVPTRQVRHVVNGIAARNMCNARGNTTDGLGSACVEASSEGGQRLWIGTGDRILLGKREGIEPENRAVLRLDVAEESMFPEDHAHEAAGRRHRREVDEAARTGQAGIDRRRRFREGEPARP
jgi:hypothetical protein